MSGEEFDKPDLLQQLYRETARERSSAAIDAKILRAAHARTRESRRRAHFLGIALIAAVLVVVVARMAQREHAAAEAIRTRYAEITLPYLLGREADTSPFARATRYLLERRELEQPASDAGSADQKSRGI